MGWLCWAGLVLCGPGGIGLGFARVLGRAMLDVHRPCNMESAVHARLLFMLVEDLLSILTTRGPGAKLNTGK